jgi:hypothetical protein
VRLRLEPDDEYLHEVDDSTNFNESMYFNVYDPTPGVGGFFRLGNRPNEGYAEMTTCIYLPDGTVGFMFARPPIESNDAFDAGGMRFRVHEPFESIEVSYEGQVVVLEDPLEMADPRAAFTGNPWEPCSVRLAYRGLAPAFGGEPVEDDGSPVSQPDDMTAAFAKGHYEQHVAAAGTVTVGDRTWDVDGYGLRDHSWGPRHWQTPWWYRWLTANFGDDLGFMFSIITSRDGEQRTGGIVLRDGAYERVDNVVIETEWEGADQYHQRLRARARTAEGVYEVEGEVMSLVPLRNRRTTADGERLVTRISEGMTRWTMDGRTGYGLSEYLDQIVDGIPVGVTASR